MLRCPIPTDFRENRRFTDITQVFGAHPNQLFYGPEGHEGLDLRSIGEYKYRYRDNGQDDKHYLREERSPLEKKGNIPVLAAHDGTLSALLYDRNKWGWGMQIVSNDGKFRTWYWHIESPWMSWKNFKGIISTTLRSTQVKAGQVIAIAGNTGRSTAPHVHFEYQEKVGDKWVPKDPMPHLTRGQTIYRQVTGIGQDAKRRYWYNGEEITREQAEKITFNV